LCAHYIIATYYSAILFKTYVHDSFPKERKITYLVATPPSPCGINKAGTGYQNPAPALAIVIIYFSNN